jgi:hypothetical protein
LKNPKQHTGKQAVNTQLRKSDRKQMQLNSKNNLLQPPAGAKPYCPMVTIKTNYTKQAPVTASALDVVDSSNVPGSSLPGHSGEQLVNVENVEGTDG